VLAAQVADMLQRFVTSYYFKGRSPLPRIVDAIAPGNRFTGLLRRRWHPEINPQLVTTFGRQFFAARAGGALFSGLVRGARVWSSQWETHRFDKRVANWLRHQPVPTIVHAFEGSASASLAAARQLGSQTVLDVPSAHEYLIDQCRREGERFVGLNLELIRQRIQRERDQADYLFVPSEMVRRCLVENHVETARIISIPYGVDEARFAPCSTPRSSATFRVLYVGKIHAGKGLNYLLSAWKALDLPDSELVLVGGADEFGTQLLKASSANFTWLGNVSPDEIHVWFRESDIFVFPSLAEGSALVTYEAMAAGLPVVITQNAGGVARDGLEGFVVPVRDSDALASRIAHLHDHPEVRLRMGRNARQLIVNEYTWQHYRGRIVAAYRAIAAGLPVQEAVGRANNQASGLRRSGHE
jgi:glycosyltransferase involved in cell wall biosynthesis